MDAQVDMRQQRKTLNNEIQDIKKDIKELRKMFYELSNEICKKDALDLLKKNKEMLKMYERVLEPLL